MTTYSEFFERWFPGVADPVAEYHRVLTPYVDDTRRILDLGCGDNRILERYRTGEREVWGADFHSHTDLAAPEWFRPLLPDGTTTFPDQSFDLIGACWVLEHVTDPDAFLAEVWRILKPGGHFVALSVNAWHYVSALIRTIGMLPHPVTQWLVRRLYGRAEHDTFPTVYRMNSEATLRRLCRRQGMQMVGVPRIANAGYFAFQPLLGKAAVLFDWTLDQLAAELGRLYFVAVLRKPETSARGESLAFAA